MARIRTIKPEFPQSQSVGRLSRNARLLFVMLWTQADDDGRLRGHSRMLASLLYPYDDDAPGLIEGWLGELEREGCIRRYVVQGDHYLDIPKWLSHQKIDKSKPSKLPAFDEASRRVANGRDELPQDRDQGPSIKDREEDPDPAPDGASECDAAVIEYNALAESLSLPKAEKLTAPRRSRLKARLRDCGGIEGWRAALAKVRDSPFLRGETSKDGWRADLDFLLQESSFVKVMEGRYDGRKTQSGGDNGWAQLIAGGRV